jgi:hypothetical protein
MAADLARPMGAHGHRFVLTNRKIRRMPNADMTPYFLLGIEAALVVLWYLLRQKDAHQQASIDLLFKKHDDDAQKLADLELKIAQRHYEKPDVDGKFDRIESAVNSLRVDVAQRLDKLTDALLAGKEMH